MAETNPNLNQDSNRSGYVDRSQQSPYERETPVQKKMSKIFDSNLEDMDGILKSAQQIVPLFQSIAKNTEMSNRWMKEISDYSVTALKAEQEKYEQERIEYELKKKSGELTSDQLKQLEEDYVKVEQRMSAVAAINEKIQQQTKAQLDINQKVSEKANKVKGEQLLKWLTAGGLISEFNKRANKSYEQNKKDADAAREKREKGEQLSSQEKSSIFKDTFVGFMQGLSKALDGLVKKIDDSFKSVEGVFTNYQSEINARLGLGANSGQDTPFQDIIDEMRKNFGSSTFVKMNDVLGKLKEAVGKGMARDVEMMAFIEAVKDDVQSTFDAFDSNLLRVIRLQDSNSTVARLGLESSLNDLFLRYFDDTTYLSDVYDSINSTLVDAMSQMSAQQGVEFEYIVQKWLGALYETGVSSNAVTNIGQGIGYLATGNVNALSSNSQLQQLLALSANRAGLDYAGMLTDGITAKQTNELMKSMVEYLAEIAESTEGNRVVANAYGQVLGGMSLSDIKGFSNLKGQIQNIYGYQQSYEDLSQNAINEVSAITNRQHLSAWISNLTDNVMFSTVAGIVDSPAQYITYKTADVVEGLLGDAQIAGISLKAVPQLAKAGLFGYNLLGTIGSAVENYNNGGLNSGALSMLTRNTENVYSQGIDNMLSTTSGTTAAAVIGSGDSYDRAVAQTQDSYSSTEQFLEDAGLREDQEKLEDFEEQIMDDFATLNKNLFSSPVSGNGTLVSIADSAKNTYEKINSLINSTNDYINVNISGLTLTDDQPLPIRLSSVGSQQMFAQLKAITDRFGVGDADAATLQDLIDLFYKIKATGESLNVHLKTTDIGMREVLNNTAENWSTYQQRY